MIKIKRLGMLFFFVGATILMTLAIAQFTGLPLNMSGGIAAFTCILVYLMVDRKPKPKPDEGTLIRLTRGNWHRRK